MVEIVKCGDTKCTTYNTRESNHCMACQDVQMCDDWVEVEPDFESLKTLFNGHGIQILSTRVSRGDVEPEEIVISDGKYTEAE